MKKLTEILKNGILKENPTFGLILGLCPTLAVSTSIINALGMGFAATFVLICSNGIVSSVRTFIPDRIRLPAFIVIIATFVTICELVLKAYFPVLDASLGIFVPLIVVNCIILARAEAFASKNAFFASVFDGLGMGIGFTIGLCTIAFIREVIGAASIAGFKFLPRIEAVTIMILSPGALLTLGLLIGIVNLVRNRKSNKNTDNRGGCCG